MTQVIQLQHDMAISKHPSGDITRLMCGIRLLDHKQSHWTQIHRQKTGKVLKNHLQNSQTKERHQEEKTHTQQN